MSYNVPEQLIWLHSTLTFFQAHSSRTFWYTLRMQYKRLKMTTRYEKTIPDDRLRFTHTALIMLQLTTIANPFSVTISSTLAKEMPQVPQAQSRQAYTKFVSSSIERSCGIRSINRIKKVLDK